MTRFAAILLITGIVGCGTVGGTIDPELAAGIPDGAVAVRISSDQPPDEFYRTIYQTLEVDGFEIGQSNSAARTLTTGPRNIGQGTSLRIRVAVQSTSGGSAATFNGNWDEIGQTAGAIGGGYGAQASTEGGPARWEPSGRPRVAFGYIATLAHDIPHVSVEYPTQ